MEIQNRFMHVDEIQLIRSDSLSKAVLCSCFLSSKLDYKFITRCLNEQERTYFETLHYERRIRSYLIGRYTAKHAVATLIGEKNINAITINSGIFSQPLVISSKQNVQVSITHCDNFGATLAFSEDHPMGIDIEKIYYDRQSVLESQMTEAEVNKLRSLSISYEAGLTLLWTAKEALSKILKTGLMTPFQVFEISKIERRDHHTISTYKNFAQYQVISFPVGSYMCSIAKPYKSQLVFDIQEYKEKLAALGL